MPKGYPLVECRICHVEVSDRSYLSARGLCSRCGPAIQGEQVRQLVAHRGPHFEHWRQRCIAAFTSPRLDNPHTGR